MVLWFQNLVEQRESHFTPIILGSHSIAERFITDGVLRGVYVQSVEIQGVCFAEAPFFKWMILKTED